MPLMKSTKLFWKVFLACVFLMVVSAGLFSLLVTRELSEAMRSEFHDRLRASTYLLASAAIGPLAEDQADTLQPIMQRLGQDTGTRLTVWIPPAAFWPIPIGHRQRRLPRWTTIWIAPKSSRRWKGGSAVPSGIA